MENKQAILKFQILSMIVCMILGTLLHFTFEWSHGNKIVASFSAVNESVWEHLKLVFFPMLLMAIIGYFLFGKTLPNYWCAQALGILTGIAFVTIFFYTYTGILGTNLAILDIGSFFIAVLLGTYVTYRQMLLEVPCDSLLAGGILAILLVFFILFTYQPPKIAYFKDPVTGTYGIEGK